MSSSSLPKKKKSLLRRIFKWTGITFLLLLIAVIVLPFIFKDKLIQLAKDEANKSLNAKVNFGSFDLTLFSSFPNFRFKIDSVQVIGVKEFEKDTLAFIGHTEIDMDLMSVISGDKYKVKSIALENPRISAIVLADGKANWDITKPATDTTGSADTSATKFALSLKKLEIKNAHIRYNDASMGFTSALEGMDFTLGGDFTQDNFLMDISSEIQKLSMSYGGVAYAKNIHTKLKLGLNMDMPNMKFTVKDNEVNLNDLTLSTEGFVAMPKEDIDMDLKFACKQTEFKSLLSLVPNVYTKDFASVKTAGKLALNGFAKGTYNDKTMPGFGAHLEVTDAMFKYPSLPKSVNNINIKVDVNNPNGNPDATKIDIHRFHVEMAGNPLDMTLHVSTPVSDPNLLGEINGKLDLSSVKDFIPLEKGDDMNGNINANVKLNGRMSMIEQEKYDEFKAEGFVEAMNMNYTSAAFPAGVTINSMRLNFTPKYVELASFDSRMGKSDIKASGKIDDFMQYMFKDSMLHGTFTMQSNLMDLNELMGPSSADSVAPAAADSAPLSVIEVPANINFTMNSSIGKLMYDNLDITNLAGMIVVRDRRVSMEKVKMNMLDGAMTMSGYYDTKNARKPAISYDLDITGFDIQKTFNAFNTVQKLAPIGKHAKGKFNTTLTGLKGTLDEAMMPDMTTLIGKGSMRAKGVAVEGFEPIVKLAEALKNDNMKKMEFADIASFFQIKDGRLIMDPFDTKIKNVDARIAGSTGFDQTIDYKWDLKIPTKDLPAQATNVVQGFLSQASQKTGQTIAMPDKVEVTALIGGTVTKPVIKTGMKDMMKDVKNEIKEEIKKVVEEKIEEVKEDVKAKARAEAEKILADAQKEADNIKAEAARAAQQIRDEGNKKADELEKSGGNMLEKMANKKLAEKLRKETEAKAQKVTDEANAKADKIMADAKTKSDEKLK